MLWRRQVAWSSAHRAPPSWLGVVVLGSSTSLISTRVTLKAEMMKLYQEHACRVLSGWAGFL